MQTIKQKGLAIIEYAVVLAFILGLGTTLLATTGLGEGVKSSIVAVERLLGFEDDGETIPSMSEKYKYAQWLLEQLRKKLANLDPETFLYTGGEAKVESKIGETLIQGFYRANNIGPVVNEPNDTGVASVWINSNSYLHLYDSDGKLIAKLEPQEVSSLKLDDNKNSHQEVTFKDGSTYDKNVTTGTVSIIYNGKNINANLNGYDFVDMPLGTDSVRVSYSNYNGKKVINGMYYRTQDNTIISYVGTNKDGSTGVWAGDID